MNQKELAQALGISPGMVSRLAKRGMPTDSLQRAQRWRKRHLEPGRVKGSRFDPNAVPDAQTSAPAREQSPAAAPSPIENLVRLAAKMQALAQAANAELIEVGGCVELADLEPLRCAMRAWPTEAISTAPALPLRVWLALNEFCLLRRSPLWQYPNRDEPMGVARLAQVAGIASNGTSFFVSACDDPERYDWRSWGDDEEGDADTVTAIPARVSPDSHPARLS